MDNNRNYFKTFFKSWNFVFALLLASLAMTIVGASYKYGLLNKILGDKQIFTFTAILFAIITVAVIVYMCLNLKNKKITIADSLYFALVFAGIIFFIFVGCVLKSFNLNRITIPITFLTVGIFFFTIRIHLYSTIKE